MTTDEIRTLSRLSRIALSDAEVETFNQEIDAILAYVGAVKDMVGDDVDTKSLGARYNVLRSDVVTNTPGQYTAPMLAAMPKTSGEFLVVKKILKQD